MIEIKEILKVWHAGRINRADAETLLAAARLTESEITYLLQAAA
jgi:hypothetical protein